VTGGDFASRSTKDDRVRISRGGRVVTTLAGRSAQRFLSRLEGADDDAAQLEMARVTGNYKRGNER
jgi:hypothetical protein